MGTCALSGFLALPAEGKLCAGQFAPASQSQSRNEDRTDRMRIGQAENDKTDSMIGQAEVEVGESTTGAATVFPPPCQRSRRIGEVARASFRSPPLPPLQAPSKNESKGAGRKEQKIPFLSPDLPVLSWPKGATQSFNLEFRRGPSARLLCNSNGHAEFRGR